MNAVTAVYNPNFSHQNQAIAAVSAATTAAVSAATTAAVSAATTTSLLQNDGRQLTRKGDGQNMDGFAYIACCSAHHLQHSKD